MTHSLHRQGSYSNLGDDYVVLGLPGRHFDDVQQRRERFKEIGSRWSSVNVPGVRTWQHLVYDSSDKVDGVLRDLAAAELGLSITVMGLWDQVGECCQATGLTPHTVIQSLGIWGRTEKLAHPRVLEITTMCGHSRVSPNLVRHLVGEVQHKRLAVEAAARKMGRLCLCNIFNEVRARHLMEALVAEGNAAALSLAEPPLERDVLPKKDFGITIDGARCTGCMECIPYCSVSALVPSPVGDAVSIDPQRCTECGVCFQSAPCPTQAIVAQPLTWPRTVRGRFHNLHSPYREAPPLSPVSLPTPETSEGYAFSAYNTRTELINDVNGLYRPGQAYIVVEMGRPYLGVTFGDVQKVAQALLPLGLQFHPGSPLADLVADASRGTFREDILGERTGWVTLGVAVPYGGVRQTLDTLRQVATEIDTVFAVGVAGVVAGGFPQPRRLAEEAGFTPAANAKTNVGLGRPLATF